MLHARDRRDAIERDSMDDMRRADRDKEETLRSQRLARFALATAKESIRSSSGPCHCAYSTATFAKCLGNIYDYLFAVIFFLYFSNASLDHKPAIFIQY